MTTRRCFQKGDTNCWFHHARSSLQCQDCDLRRVQEAYRRPPKPGAPGGEDEKVTVPVETGSKGLEEVDQERVRKELSAVGVTRKLQIKASFGHREGVRWAMREHQPEVNPHRAVGDGKGIPSCLYAAPCRILQPGYEQRRASGRNVMLFSVEDNDTKTLEMTDPVFRAGVVFVVARHKKGRR